MKDRRDYGREPWEDGLEREIHEQLGEPVTGEWLPGDVALMRWENRPEAGHVGIIGSDQYGLTLIHSNSKIEKVVEHRIDEHWRSLILEVFRP